MLSTGNKIRVLVAAEKGNVIYDNLVSILKKEFIVKKWYIEDGSKRPKSTLLKWASSIKKWTTAMKTFSPQKVIICGGALICLWIWVFLSKVTKNKVEIIIFRYDIEHFWTPIIDCKDKISHLIAIKLEKYCMVNSNKIIHKGLDNELEYLPFYNKIKDKPRYLFREFLNKKSAQKFKEKVKLSKKDGSIHLVYVGGMRFKDCLWTESFWKFYPKITSQKIHLHIYSPQPKDIVSKLKDAEGKDPYLHYKGYIEHHELRNKLPKYDYGIHLFGNGLSKKVQLYERFAFSNKNYDYLAARIPIITSKNLIAVSEFVSKNRLGFCIDYDDLKQIKNMIKKDNSNYNDSINKFIKNFSADKLISFIKN